MTTPPSALPAEFSRIKRLPAYVFNVTSELKMAARRAGTSPAGGGSCRNRGALHVIAAADERDEIVVREQADARNDEVGRHEAAVAQDGEGEALMR